MALTLSNQNFFILLVLIEAMNWKHCKLVRIGIGLISHVKLKLLAELKFLKSFIQRLVGLFDNWKRATNKKNQVCIPQIKYKYNVLSQIIPLHYFLILKKREWSQKQHLPEKFMLLVKIKLSDSKR